MIRGDKVAVAHLQLVTAIRVAAKINIQKSENANPA
jgi:hypothetical protein